MTFELGWGGESNIEKKITGKKGKDAYYLPHTHKHKTPFPPFLSYYVYRKNRRFLISKKASTQTRIQPVSSGS